MRESIFVWFGLLVPSAEGQSKTMSSSPVLSQEADAGRLQVLGQPELHSETLYQKENKT
jgi:hypothetical protein